MNVRRWSKEMCQYRQYTVLGGNGEVQKYASKQILTKLTDWKNTRYGESPDHRKHWNLANTAGEGRARLGAVIEKRMEALKRESSHCYNNLVYRNSYLVEETQSSECHL